MLCLGVFVCNLTIVSLDALFIRLYFLYVRRVHLFHLSFLPARLQSVMGEDRKRPPHPQGILNGGRAFTGFHHGQKSFSLYGKQLFSIDKSAFYYTQNSFSLQTKMFFITVTNEKVVLSVIQSELCHLP